MQTKPRTHEIVPNQNISFPIGTIYAVEKLYQVLNYGDIFLETQKEWHRYQQAAKSPHQLQTESEFQHKKGS